MLSFRNVSTHSYAIFSYSGYAMPHAPDNTLHHAVSAFVLRGYTSIILMSISLEFIVRHDATLNYTSEFCRNYGKYVDHKRI